MFLFVVLPRSPLIGTIMDVVVFEWMLIVLLLILQDIHSIMVAMGGIQFIRVPVEVSIDQFLVLRSRMIVLWILM